MLSGTEKKYNKEWVKLIDFASIKNKKAVK
jgi:hypothetical protein